MGCCPSYFHRSPGFSCEGLGLRGAVRRAVEEGYAGVRARGCARGGGAAAVPRTLTRAPGGAGVSAAPGPATHGAVYLRGPPTTRSSPPPAHPARPSAPSPPLLRPPTRPPRPLSGRAPARSLVPDLASEPPRGAGRAGGTGALGARAGSPQPASRGEGCDRSGRRPQRVPSGRRGSAPCAPPRALGPQEPAGARLLSARPFGCQRPGGWRGTPRRGQRAPR